MLQGLRPTTFLLRKQPHSKWRGIDFPIAEGYQIHQDETSGNSGLPIWISRTLDPEVSFLVETTVDQADKALEEWDETHQGKKRQKGVTRYAVPVNVNGEPIELGGLVREKFYTADPIRGERATVDDDLDVDLIKPPGGYNPADYGDGA